MANIKEILTPEFLRWMVAMIFFAGVSYATFASKTYVDEADRRLQLSMQVQMGRVEGKLDALLLQMASKEKR